MPESTPLPKPPIVRENPAHPDLEWLQKLLKENPAVKLAPGTCSPLPLSPGETPPAGFGSRKSECHI